MEGNTQINNGTDAGISSSDADSASTMIVHNPRYLITLAASRCGNHLKKVPIVAKNTKAQEMLYTVLKYENMKLIAMKNRKNGSFKNSDNVINLTLEDVGISREEFGEDNFTFLRDTVSYIVKVFEEHVFPKI